MSQGLQAVCHFSSDSGREFFHEYAVAPDGRIYCQRCGQVSHDRSSGPLSDARLQEIWAEVFREQVRDRTHQEASKTADEAVRGALTAPQRAREQLQREGGEAT